MVTTDLGWGRGTELADVEVLEASPDFTPEDGSSERFFPTVDHRRGTVKQTSETAQERQRLYPDRAMSSLSREQRRE